MGTADLVPYHIFCIYYASTATLTLTLSSVLTRSYNSVRSSHKIIQICTDKSFYELSPVVISSEDDMKCVAGPGAVFRSTA